MPDPLAENHVQRIETQAGTFIESLDVLDADRSFDALIQVCQRVNNVRLQFGRLNVLDPHHQIRVEKALVDVLERAHLLLHLSDSRRKWIRRGVASVAKFLVELEPEEM